MDQLTKAWDALPGVALPPGGDFKALPGKDIPKAPEPRVIHEPVGESAGAILGGALNDTFQTGNARPNADPLGRAVFQPKNLPEAVIREAVMAPAAAVSMPARIATAGLSGGVSALGSGKSGGTAAWNTLLDAIVAGGAEGVMAGGSKLATRAARKAGDLAKPLLEGAAKSARSNEMYQKSFTALEEVWQSIKSRLPKGADVYAPTLSSKPLTPQQAIDALKDAKLEGKTYAVALAEVGKEFNRLDSMAAMASTRATPTTPVAQQFVQTPAASLAGSRLEAAAPQRFTPRPAPTGTYPQQQAAKSVESNARRAERLRDPKARAAADIAATTPTDEGEQPAGAKAALMAGSQLGNLGHLPYYYLLRHVP